MSEHQIPTEFEFNFVWENTVFNIANSVKCNASGSENISSKLIFHTKLACYCYSKNTRKPLNYG